MKIAYEFVNKNIDPIELLKHIEENELKLGDSFPIRGSVYVKEDHILVRFG